MKKKYCIGEVAKATAIPVKTLRYYDEIGLVNPEYRDKDSNYRYYSKQQMVNLFIIRQLKTLGFSLKDIKDIFSDSQLSKLEQKVTARLLEIEDEIKLLQQKRDAGLILRDRLTKGNDILAQLKEDFAASEEAEDAIRTEYIEKNYLFYSRSIMPKYENAEVSLDRWIDITDNCRSHNLKVNSPIIVTYYNEVLDQYLMKDCDVEFGVLVEDIHSEGEAKRLESVRPFGGFQAATSIHVGNYRTIMARHVQMIQWIHQHDYEIAGPVSEEFIVSPIDIDNEDEHITKIIIPIEKKSHPS